jgi:hypothetical protein
MTNEALKEDTTPSLTVIRLKYLRGEMDWETYQRWEKQLSIRFSERRQEITQPDSIQSEITPKLDSD